MTAIEPVKNNDVISPAYNGQSAPEILISDLQQGYVNFEWKRKDGADIYFFSIEPVVPGLGPTWCNSIVSDDPNVSLSENARKELANLLSNPSYAGQTMKWRVYCRHQADTNPALYKGQENRFIIGSLPPSFP